MTPTLPEAPKSTEYFSESGVLSESYKAALKTTFPEVRELDGYIGCWSHPEVTAELQRCFVFRRLNELESYVYQLERSVD